MNLNKLKGKIRECGKTYAKCADALDMSYASFAARMNGKRQFYIDELDDLGDFLEMTREERADIYLR